MYNKCFKFLCIILFSLSIGGCIQASETNQAVVNQYAEAFLTRNNELQFRFKINHNILNIGQVYKVRVAIHNKELASALGKDEIIYGADANYHGKYIEVENSSNHYIYMNPIPLVKDLHVFDIKDMIVNKEAVSVEVFNDEEVIAKALLTNFSSQL